MSMLPRPPMGQDTEDARPAGSGQQRVVDRSIGDLIRSARQLTDLQINEILAYQRSHSLRFGEAAISLGLASREDVLWAISQQFHYPYTTEHSPQAFEDELTVARDPFSDQAEVFRDVRSQLLAGVLSPEHRSRALAVVSTQRGDGKTYFAANLAVAFSQLGMRTLLVDADMRTPRQHTLFGISSRTGLSSMLAERDGLDTIEQIVALPGLFVLPAGAQPPNPLELVQRMPMDLLLLELRKRFEVIIIDTPAAVHGADARVTASKCGAALLIGRRGRSSLAEVERFSTQLQRGQVKLAGVLLNEH